MSKPEAANGDSPRLIRTHAERRREAEARILQAALGIIAERGLDQLTLAEAGEAAGYSRALPAHYFGSREALLAATAEHVVEGYRQRRREQLHPDAPRGIEPLLAAIAFYIDESRKSAPRLRAFYEVLNAGLKRPEIAPSIARLNQDSVDGYARLIEDAVALGEIRADVAPKAQAVAIIGTLRGVMMQWLTAPGQVDLDAVRDELVASLRRSWAV